MDLAAISAFVSVGESGNFGSTARSLGMTSSGVSKAISRLETNLGVQLLARTTRSVRLTPAGAAFHARCRAILGDLEEAERQATAASAEPQGRLTIAVSDAYGRNRVIPVVAEFMKRHPKVLVHAKLSDRFVDLVEEGVDIAVRIGHLRDSGLIAARLAETRFVLCGSPGYLSRTGRPTHPDELATHRGVVFVSPGTAIRMPWQFVVDGEVRSIVPEAALTVDDGEALVAAASASVGLVWIQDYLVDELFRKRRLVRVLSDFETPPVPISIVHLPSRHPSPAARALIAMLKRGRS